MDERFIEFRGGPSRSGATRIKISLNHRGVFNLNQVAVRKLETPEAITLHYDVHKRVIGIKPAEPWRPNAFPLRVKNKMQTRSINARSFCKHFDIKVLRTIEFNNVRTGEDGVIRLSLDDTTLIGKEPNPA